MTLALDSARATRRILLSTVSSDAHTWNLVFLQLLLEEAGIEVVNLGPCVPDDLLLAAAREIQPDAIVISTVNGHGCSDGTRIARLLKTSPQTRQIPMLIGGKLGISAATARAGVRDLLDSGFDVVFSDDADPASLLTQLEELPRAVAAARE